MSLYDTKYYVQSDLALTYNRYFCAVVYVGGESVVATGVLSTITVGRLGQHLLPHLTCTSLYRIESQDLT